MNLKIIMSDEKLDSRNNIISMKYPEKQYIKTSRLMGFA